MSNPPSDLADREKASGVMAEEENETGYPPRKVVLPAMGAIALAVFLIALDRTILGTAIPSISNEFQSFGDIAWYEAGFLLPLCMLQLTFGRVYTYYSTKWVLWSLVAIFEIGSIVCATAPNSKALIVGRAITGIGGAGISSGALNLINILVPLRSRPKYAGCLGSVFGLASIIGPLIGGFLTAVTWRWCFWINVPIGAISLVVLAFLTPNSPAPLKPANSLWKRINQLDPLGFFLIAVATVCLLFPLQWGGIQYPWNDGRIIALFVLAGVFGIAFVGAQIWRKEDGTVPARIFLQRTMLASSIASIGIGALIVVYSFYLPIWFQAIKGDSPQSSGIALLGLLLANVVFVMIGGIGTSTIGYFTPFMIVGSAILIVGAGLITTWQVDTGSNLWIGYQVIAGAGLGLTFQQPNIAAQTVLPKEDVPTGVSLITFIQFLSGTIFVTVSQTLLENKLISGLEGKVQGLDPSAIANQGATSLRQLVSADQLQFVLNVYNDALRNIWYLSLGMACLVFLGSFGFEWKSVKDEEKAAKDKEQQKEKKEEVDGEKEKEEGK